MMTIEAMTDAEVMAELKAISDRWNSLLPREADGLWDALESNLHTRAACLGWTGDPLKQPPRSVLASSRQVEAANAEVFA